MAERYEFERTICQECKHRPYYEYLSLHIRQSHKNMTNREYKAKYGIDAKLGLLSDETRRKKSEATKANGTISNLFSEASVENRFSVGHRRFYERSAMTKKRLREENNFVRLKKLTYEQVQEIKSRLDTERAKDLAMEYNVSEYTISNIRTGKRRTFL